MYCSVFKKKIKINDCYEGLLRMRMNPVNQSECFLVVEIHLTKMYIYKQNILYMYLHFSTFQISEILFCEFLSRRPPLNNYGTARLQDKLIYFTKVLLSR